MTGTEILIVGGGAAGIATAWALGRRGATGVVLLERERLLGTQSSALNAAILRTLSHDPHVGALSRRGADFLHAPPPRFSSLPLVQATGLFLTADATAAPRLARALESAGPEAGGTRVDARRVRAAYVGLEHEFELALWFPREGRIDIAALMAGFERGARATGIRIETGARVDSLIVEEGRVRGVRLAGGDELRARRTVLAAGAWAGALGAAAGSAVALEPRRRHLMVTTATPDHAPGTPVLWHEGAEPFYVRPESGGVLFCVCDESVVDPDRCRTDPAVRERLVSRALERLPDLARTGVSSFWAGMRTFARDQRFAIGPDPDLPGLHWVAGLGGHGMVCAAPAGELAADGLLGGTGDDDLRSAFDPSRLVPGKNFSPPVPRRGPDRGFPLQGTPLGSRSLPFEAP